jgi:hypothetical protein
VVEGITSFPYGPPTPVARSSLPLLPYKHYTYFGEAPGMQSSVTDFIVLCYDCPSPQRHQTFTEFIQLLNEHSVVIRHHKNPSLNQLIFDFRKIHVNIPLPYHPSSMHDFLIWVLPTDILYELLSPLSLTHTHMYEYIYIYICYYVAVPF